MCRLGAIWDMWCVCLPFNLLLSVLLHSYASSSIVCCPPPCSQARLPAVILLSIWGLTRGVTCRDTFALLPGCPWHAMFRCALLHIREATEESVCYLIPLPFTTCS